MRVTRLITSLAGKALKFRISDLAEKKFGHLEKLELAEINRSNVKHRVHLPLLRGP